MNLLEQMVLQNPWWEGKEIERIKGLKERTLLKELSKYAGDPQIIAVTGLRRVGKTILLHQLISYLLRKTEPKRILYFSFDEILGKDLDIIDKVISLYETDILKGELRDVYILFDEISHIRDWQVILKRYYDLSKNIKFFVSGSSSLFIRKSKESLAGRIYEFELEPLAFREFMHLRGKKIDNIAVRSREIKRELSNYTVRGGFPEIMDEEDFQKISNYVSSIVDKVVFYDMPRVYDVGEPGTLKEILAIIARKPGMLLEYKNIASHFNISYQTVSKYVSYLEKSFLTRLLYNYRGSPVARARKSKKAYPYTHSLIPAFMSQESELHKLRGEIAETMVVAHTNAEFFWRKYFEVDVLQDKNPIEVKYREDAKDIKGALNVAKTLKSKRLTVVTKDTESMEVRQGVRVVYVPLWKFLMREPR